MKHSIKQIREIAGLHCGHALLPQSNCKSMGISRKGKEAFLLMNSKIITKFQKEIANTIFINMQQESTEMLIWNEFI